MNLIGQLLRFGIVGGTAAGVHLLVLWGLVHQGLPPLGANPPAFLIAFQVTYLGHRHWTFRSQGTSGELGRMFAVSLASFVSNEILYALLLRSSPWDYRILQLATQGIVAALTFVATRIWVFKPGTEAP